MKVELRCKPNQMAYYLDERQETIIPCVCNKVEMTLERGVEYYFDKFVYSFVDEEFDDEIFMDYNLACDKLEDLRNGK